MSTELTSLPDEMRKSNEESAKSSKKAVSGGRKFNRGTIFFWKATNKQLLFLFKKLMMQSPYPFLIAGLFLFLSVYLQAQLTASNFSWPENKRAALSLTFDDARLSNVDVGTVLFDKHEVKATFYVIPSGVRERLEEWKQAVKAGHEIGNHTLVHPCSGNFSWSREKALENYNLASMRRELLTANQEIEELLGVTPVSFAYTCGQTYVGRGRETRSYVPLIAELFTSGRGWLDEAGNDPNHVDLAQLQGIEMDGKDFESDIKPILEEAVKNGHWIVLAGHEIGEGGFQTTRVDMLEQLIAYVQRPESGIWLAPVGTITKYVKAQRAEQNRQLADALTFGATFDQGFDAEFARGNAKMFTLQSDDQGQTPKVGMHNPNIKIAKAQGRFGHALAFAKKSSPPIYFSAKENVDYDTNDWSGTISLWLSLDPETDLEPGYVDPIQVTDAGYNDAALWVDFSDKNPRSFRMGAYGDLEVWNPENIGPDENPAFQQRLLTAEDRPFGKGIWTHITITFSHLNTQKGQAMLYVNGKPQGEREISEPFTWEVAEAKIFLGLNYVGLMDELALFNRALTPDEVRRLYELPNGLRTLMPD